MANEGFTVDTHLFRELGELLVGRDSTALVELIKNAYDADATEVTVDGERLDQPGKGRITISDTGIGMSPDQFRRGFLRIASRLKDSGEPRSPKYGRRFTGAKGIGRLAAHKLARFVHITSIPDLKVLGRDSSIVEATIDWDAIEKSETLDQLALTGAIQVLENAYPKKARSGTIIELRKLRRKWTPTERARFFAEVETFSPPPQLIDLPKVVLKEPLLFGRPHFADANPSDPGCRIALTGDLNAGESYWIGLAQTAQWVIEIDADGASSEVVYAVSPTKTGQHEFGNVQASVARMPHPDSELGPHFQARILIREGVASGRDERVWLGRSSGIRVYMEGFRVLPYGEPGDDWLSIDRDYTHRSKSLPFLVGTTFAGDPADESEGLLSLRNTSYFGAIFLTMKGASSLRMLVNREGFIPERGFDTLTRLVRIGIDYSVRIRALAKTDTREARSEERKHNAVAKAAIGERTPQEFISGSLDRARELARKAREHAAAGNYKLAEIELNRAADEFSESSNVTKALMTEPAMLRILASVGTQMTAFVHEINSLLGAAVAVESAIERLRKDLALPAIARRHFAQIHQAIGDLRRSVERQASFLTDVTSPDARRRRSRQRLCESFTAGSRLVQIQAEKRDITITNDISFDVKSPPMFPAELTMIFSNLLTNAVKAAGNGGAVRARAEIAANTIIMTIENTGAAVNLEDAERWFQPFESSTLETDPVLGQGMGMGLPITRNILEQYGATIGFVKPTKRFATAVQIRLPG